MYLSEKLYLKLWKYLRIFYSFVVLYIPSHFNPCQSSWHPKGHTPVKLSQNVPIWHLPQYKEQPTPYSPCAHTKFFKRKKI